MNAYQEIENRLEEGEQVESVTFGNWGSRYGTGEPQPSLVPESKRGIVLRWDEAKKYMTGWSFAATEDDCYPAYIWTNKRIFFVHEYDGSILLMDLPRHPTDGMAHYIGMM